MTLRRPQIQNAQAIRLRDTEGQAPEGGPFACRSTKGGHAMRAFDFAPLYRSTVGFDRMFSMLDQLDGVEGSVSSYPPYNIERSGENAFRISVAVAGFTDADLSIETKENRLTIRGEKQTNDRGEGRRRPLQGHRRADLRTWLPARRPCSGQRREPGERAPKRRACARDSGGDEASGDPNHELQQASGGQADQGRCLRLRRILGAPRFSGALFL